MNLRVNHSVKYLCPNHYKDNFQKYSGWYKKCCDPCLRHKKPRRSLLEVISLKFAQKVFQYTEYRIIPGQKICKSCRDFLTQFIDPTENNNKIEHTETEDQSKNVDQSNDDDELSLCHFKYNLDSVNNALRELGLKSLSVTQAQSSSLVEKKLARKLRLSEKS